MAVRAAMIRNAAAAQVAQEEEGEGEQEEEQEEEVQEAGVQAPVEGLGMANMTILYR